MAINPLMSVKAPSTERINLRVSDPEKFVLKSRADSLGLSLTDYIMYAVQLEINSYRLPDNQIDFFADKKLKGLVPEDLGLY